eukprot:CAMPEP_0206513956 /NCGR_PEP_ID=MMETSP0324_2-20121206/61837_1 /ASSEMBLY_ACC=CAM_ASM_000836 /TAXON_ID=2866 /ORGANISM="Crypthecodinium cohnii, Strain Seligo" /LENGTH=282 /DNA_ID=CAMNT_0054006311 /DNA_START=44 /DNA_END=892 /DNA_ORIENTATION=+
MNDPFGPKLNKDGTEKMPTREEVIMKIEGMQNDPHDYKPTLAILELFGWALRYAPIMFRCERSTVEAALKSHGRALEYAHPDLRDNPEIVQLACEHDGMALAFASERLRADKGIVLTAVSRAGAALELTSKALRDNKQVVLTAVQNDGQAMLCASERLRCNKKFITKAVTRNRECFEYIDPSLKHDTEIVRAAFGKVGKLPGIRPKSPPILSPRDLLHLRLAPEAKLDRVFGGGGGPRPPLRINKSFSVPPGGFPRRRPRKSPRTSPTASAAVLTSLPGASS